MKNKDFQSLRQKDDKELKKQIEDIKGELLKLNLNIQMRKEKNTGIVVQKKKDIARIQTILQERKTENVKQS